MRRLLVVLALVACGPATDGPAPAPPPPASSPLPAAVEPPAMDPEAARRLAATARFLAGLDEAAAPVAVDPEVGRRHAGELDAAWRRLEAERLGPMREWAARHVALDAPETPLFYPFGGPDLVGALAFFPAARTTVLVGLEAPGEILLAPRAGGNAELAGPSPALAADLERLRGSFESLFEHGYFVTKRMESDFAGGSLEGVLPVLLILLARTGHEPVGAWYLSLGADGVPRFPAPGEATPNGVRVDFRPAGEPEAATRTVVFLSQDLGDEALAAAPGFAAYVRGLGPVHTLIKAAHYLLHGEGFASLAGLVLGRSRVVLQDDSGLPFAAFDPARWRVEPFGTYSDDLPAAYRRYFQPDLAALFAQGGASPLGFTLGYHAEVGGGVLILARAKAAGDGRPVG